MPVSPSLPGYRASTATKGTSRSKSAKFVRVSNSNLQTGSLTRPKKNLLTMSHTDSTLLVPPRPPDPTLFVHAGTSGVRHLFPIHLTDADGRPSSFPRSITRLRFRTLSMELCTSVDTIRNICLSFQTLEHFDISENNLDDLPSDLCSLTDLRTLNCSHNQLTNIPQALEKLAHLQEFDLSFNQLKHFPSVIYTFTQLIRFNCEHNCIRTIEGDITNLQHLKTLILDHNQLQSLDQIDFGQLKMLEYIHIAHNQLSQFPNSLHHLTHLRNVNLSSNQLTAFPIELLLVNTLDVLNLSHNLITHLSPLPDAYKRTSLIFSIDLSFNQLGKFYDYLLWISVKLDLSNNQIQAIPNDVVRRINRDTVANRELKIDHNPLTQPIALLSVGNVNTNNLLQIIRNCVDEQQVEESVRQGFKICITGGKRTGKSSLAYCLEESVPCSIDKKEERMLNVLQFPFRFETGNSKSSLGTKPDTSSWRVSVESSRKKQTSSDIDVANRKRPSRRSALPSVAQQPPAPAESVKSLPVTIFDFNGSTIYYEHMSSFLDTNAVHLVCLHPVDFHQSTPVQIEEAFHETFDISAHSILTPLLQILQLLCEKVMRSNGILIVPVATCIDLYDKRADKDRTQALDKMNQFFKLYLQYRTDRIRTEIQRINSLSLVSPALSYRLKVYTALLENTIQIEPCQPISCLTYQGIPELNQTIQRCLLTQKGTFPRVDRILPTLWIDANRYIESLADQLPVPCLSWESFTSHIIDKHGLSNLIEDIVISLVDEGKILVVSQLGASDRMVFLRPLWLADLLTALFHLDYQSASNSHSYIKEYHQSGRLHSDLVRSLWSNLVHKKEDFYSVWLTLMRLLSLGYPKTNKRQWKTLLDVGDKPLVKFDYAIVPYYLPRINLHEQESKRNRFEEELNSVVSVCYSSVRLPLGFFHRFSVSALWKLSITYLEHWNDFILGEFDEHSVKFIIETDHRTYVKCQCGTSTNDHPFQLIWNVLMLILNHFEDLFKTLAPNNQFSRCARCPRCREYSFMGEWTTPKELQGLQLKACPSCAESIDTSYLVQPNENKRRNEELLRKIRDRKANRQPTSIPLITSLV